MKQLRFLFILLLLLTIPELSAKNRNSGAAAKAAAAKKKAQLEEQKKRDEERTQMAQQYFNDVHSVAPELTLDNIKTMSPQDIRPLYVKLYVSQGMAKMDAINKASTLKIYGQ
jgi:hypothetical protein